MHQNTDTLYIGFDSSESNEFYVTLKRRVQNALHQAGKTRFADSLMLTKCVVFLILIGLSYFVVLGQPFRNAWYTLPFVFLYGTGALLLGINLAHDAVHDALSPFHRLNHWLYLFAFTLIGVDGNLWKIRHNKAHHIIPNVEGADSAVTKNPLIRLSPHQPRLRHHKFQHLYAPFLYCFVVLHSSLRQDWLYIFNWKQLANLGRVKYTVQEYVEFAVSKTAYLTISLVIPLIVLDFAWWVVVLGFLGMTALVSLLFVFLLIGTHFCEEAEFPEYDEHGRLPHNWAWHAMVTSVDWSPHSRWAQFFLGGANAHATHHLFPNICHVHYRFMSHLVEDTAHEFGVPYNKLTFAEMMRSHFRFLRRMGNEESPGNPAFPTKHYEMDSEQLITECQ